MSDKKAASLDPMRAWRDWFVGAEREWSEALTRLMKDETVARTMGEDLNANLHRQQMFAEVIGRSLASINLPTRDDVLALGERMGRLEDGLAAVQASVTQLRTALGGTVAPQAAPAGLPRTRRPPPAVDGAATEAAPAAGSRATASPSAGARPSSTASPSSAPPARGRRAPATKRGR